MQAKQKHGPGKRIKHYVLIQLIGSGGYGKVYQAQHELTKQFVAIKCVAQSTFKHHHGLVGQLHSTEIQNMSNINSEHVVKFIETIEQNKYSYIVMEYCNQGDIEKLWISKNMKFSEEEAIYYVRQIVVGMKAFHEKGIMHRDIKIKNIMLNDNSIKIGDLGFSKQLQPGEQDDCCLGMLGYMAPEVVAQQSYAFEADMFSLGALFFLFINGRLPFSDKSHEEFQKAVINHKPQYINNVTDGTRNLIDRMLKKDRNQRLRWDELYDLYQL